MKNNNIYNLSSRFNCKICGSFYSFKSYNNFTPFGLNTIHQINYFDDLAFNKFLLFMYNTICLFFSENELYFSVPRLSEKYFKYQKMKINLIMF